MLTGWRLAVRGATKAEFTTPRKGCQIRPIMLSGSLGLHLSRCSARMALGRPWRNECRIYHTLSGLSNSGAVLFQPIQRFGLSSAGPSRAQRAGTILLSRRLVKSRMVCSPRLPRRPHRPSAVQTHSSVFQVLARLGRNKGDYTPGPAACQIQDNPTSSAGPPMRATTSLRPCTPGHRRQAGRAPGV